MISLAKARIIAEATAVLDDERAAAAETLIASDLAGKTPGQIAAMIGRAVVTVGYRPGALLRHLVEVRDGQCTQPTCVRAARRCDFEHALPWEKGGRTCTCNGGCRCRRDHQVKQSPGWKVEQLPGGRHRWTTPSGRTYTNEPREYPI